jgi:hypothetical protein
MDRRLERVPEPAGERRWTRLPEPVRLEDTITSAQSSPPPEERDGAWHEVEWMLRTSGIV